MLNIKTKRFQTVLLACGIVMGSHSLAADAVERKTVRPGLLAVSTDLLFVRPLTFAVTVVGSGAFVLTLPITAATGTIGEAGATLVVDPALATFARCLGCTEVGWRKLPKAEVE